MHTPAVAYDFVYSPEHYSESQDFHFKPVLSMRVVDGGWSTHLLCALDGEPVKTGHAATAMAAMNAEMMEDCGFHL
jgi:hypothetical protein